MKIAKDWEDYRVIATGDGEKLEKWGKYTLLRPDPQVIWHSGIKMSAYKGLDGHYIRSNSGGGQWKFLSRVPEEWKISWNGINFIIKPMGFKHTGLFPEQAVNWNDMTKAIKDSGREIKVLNLFAYTGGASVVCAKAGAKVTHVDASKGMVERAKENALANGIDNIRYIIDDCKKFIEREIRRGNRYDAIIMDPPSYGRGTNGEMWKLEDNLFDFVKLTKEVLSDDPLFVLISSYTTGLQASVLSNILTLVFGEGGIDADEIGLPTDEKIVLPCGARGLKLWKN
ncbi:MAG: methyltransferase domain-containing protein [Clostridiales bacterium]|nr:methyltransferase domain-containing protein [Clostridiales bacterium]